jgi:hypothetical protein
MKEIVFTVNTERIRRIGTLLAKTGLLGDDFGTREAQAFMTLYAEQIEDKLNNVLYDFVKEKLKK